MNKTIKTFLILTFITATCWAYLLGNYMGTRLSAGFHSVSSITGGGGWSSGRTPSGGSGGSSSSGSKPASVDTSKIDTSGGAVDVSSIDLGFFSGGGSSGDITAQSNSGTSGGTVDRTKAIDVSAYAKACDGDIDKMIAAIKKDFSRTPTAEEYQTAAKKISSENKVSILSVAAVKELEAGWLTDYIEWTKGLSDTEKNKVSKMIDDISTYYEILPREARALLMEVDAEKAKQPGADSSLIVRLNALSINDPLFTGAKKNVLLQKAIAEAVPETSGQQSPKWWSDVWGGNPPTVMPSSGDWGMSMNEAVKAAELASIGGMTNPVMQARKSYLVGSCPGESYIAEGGYSESDDWLSMSDGWQPGAHIGGGSFMGNATTNVTGNSAFETSASIQQSPKWWSDVWGGNPPTVMPSSGDWGMSMNEAVKAAEIASMGGNMVGANHTRLSYLVGSCPGEPYIAQGGYVGSDDWLSMSTGWQPGAHMGGGSHMGSVEGIVEISSAALESATYWVSSDPIPTYYAKEKEEIIQNKAEEFKNEIGTNISEEMIVLALGLAIVDKGLIVTDENIREVIRSITLNEVEYYISMINKVAEEYNLTPSEAASVLKVHISNQRINDPNYKLSEENDIIKSIEANKSSSGLYIEIIQDAKTGSISPVAIDLNCDGNINLVDVAILLSFWNQNPSGFTSCQSPDINQDGKVNLADFSIMMSYWNYTFK